jgi:GT2 family glycosyltransferase
MTTGRNTVIVLGIPTIRRFDLLNQCIDSALEGSVAPDQVLVVDNSAGRCPQHAGVRYLVPTHNLGVAASWNRIADVAGGDWLILSNDDVVFAPDTIERLLTVAEDTPRAGIVSVFEGQRFCVFLLRWAAFLDVGRFEESFYPAYFEDNDYAYRLTLRGWEQPVAYSNVQHVGSATFRAFNPMEQRRHHKQFALNQERYIQRWGGKPGEEVFTTPYGVPS